MMNTITTPKQIIWYDDDLISRENAQLGLDITHWEENNKILGSAQGRGTTWFVQTDSLPAALRHYRRGGMLGRFVKDHYCFLGWKRTRSYQEFQLLYTLIDAGVNVPRPIAARAVKRTICYQADLLSEQIPHSRDLVTLLQDQVLSTEVYQKIGQEIRKMHDIQVNHTDLNIHNLLIDANQNVWIIDFDKCVIENDKQSTVDWKEDNLQRLKRSFLKEVKKRAIHWHKDDWQSLLDGYALV